MKTVKGIPASKDFDPVRLFLKKHKKKLILKKTNSTIFSNGMIECYLYFEDRPDRPIHCMYQPCDGIWLFTTLDCVYEGRELEDGDILWRYDTRKR